MKEKKYKAYDSELNKWFFFTFQEYMFVNESEQNNLCSVNASKNICEAIGITNIDSKLELYEGDIIKFRANYTNKPCEYLIGVVVYSFDSWKIKVGGCLYSIEDETDEFYSKWEYKGNICDTPELLNNNKSL